jgi:hypothetical protein
MRVAGASQRAADGHGHAVEELERGGGDEELAAEVEHEVASGRRVSSGMKRSTMGTRKRMKSTPQNPM